MASAGVGLAASFTCSKILTEAFEFWLYQLAIDAPLRVAGMTAFLAVLALRISFGASAEGAPPPPTLRLHAAIQATARFSRSCMLLQRSGKRERT
jgi:hypothetical protein